MMPPPGVVPNFDDPPNRNTMAVAVMSVCLAVSTIAMVLRFYSRWVVAQVVQWQDYLLLVAFGSYIAMLAMSYRLTSEVGWFVHTWNLRMGDVVDFLHVSQTHRRDSKSFMFEHPNTETMCSVGFRYRDVSFPGPLGMLEDGHLDGVDPYLPARRRQPAEPVFLGVPLCHLGQHHFLHCHGHNLQSIV